MFLILRDGLFLYYHPLRPAVIRESYVILQVRYTGTFLVSGEETGPYFVLSPSPDCRELCSLRSWRIGWICFSMGALNAYNDCQFQSVT
jgi:hypothetical protein